jgi:hypothetical protein
MSSLWAIELGQIDILGRTPDHFSACDREDTVITD